MRGVKVTDDNAQRPRTGDPSHDVLVSYPKEKLQSWYDCSDEVKISHPRLIFTDVRSDPPVITKTSGQIVHKTITYVVPDSTSSTEELEEITTDYHQFYYLFNKYWITFLKVNNVNECDEHDGTNHLPNNGAVDGPLCPLKANTPTHIFTIHPALNRYTPYGLYRSRQIYHNGLTGEALGCVDMQFQYTPGKISSLIS